MRQVLVERQQEEEVRIAEEELLVERFLAVEEVVDSPIEVGEVVGVVETFRVEEMRRCGSI